MTQIGVREVQRCHFKKAQQSYRCFCLNKVDQYDSIGRLMGMLSKLLNGWIEKHVWDDVQKSGDLLVGHNFC